MSTRAIVFVVLAGTFTSYAQNSDRKQFDAAACAKIMQVGLHVLEECYPSQTFGFANKPSPPELQETVAILRSIMDYLYVSVNSAASTVTVHGSPEKLAMTAWLLRELDQPVVKQPNTRMEQYLVPAPVQRELAPTRGSANDGVLKVFFLAHTENGRGVQQLLTVLRTVGDVQKVFNDTAQTALVVRCSQPQMALAEYLINELDAAAGPAVKSSDFVYKSPEGTSDLVRVFFLAHATAAPANHQIMIALHNVVEIKNVFNFTAPAAIVVRGSADEIAAAEWLVQSLDIVSPPAGTREFQIAGTNREDNVMRVFYEPHTKPDDLKSSAFDAPPALLVRGSASQIAQAGQLMQ